MWFMGERCEDAVALGPGGTLLKLWPRPPKYISSKNPSLMQTALIIVKHVETFAALW